MAKTKEVEKDLQKMTMRELLAEALTITMKAQKDLAKVERSVAVLSTRFEPTKNPKKRKR